MQRIRIESSALTSVSYDADTRCLEVEFQDGSAYEFLDLPEPLHAALLASESKGRYFNIAIRGHFQCRRSERSKT